MRRAIFAAVVGLFAPSLLATTITLREYRASLGSIDVALARRDFAGASAQAQRLLADDVSWNGTTIATDSSLLTPIAKDGARDAAAQTRQQLNAAMSALDRVQPADAAPVDAALLERVRKEETIRELQRGGEVSMLQPDDSSLWETIVTQLSRAWHWLGDKLLRLWRWIASFWPRRHGAQSSFLGMPFTVGILVSIIVGVLLILALEIWRRGRKRAAVSVTQKSSLRSANARDDDPLSRDLNEWERYANELAAAGRTREAIRAWYHAVLVALYRSGVVHYRKGKTNWEYVAALSPSLLWRAPFATFTRDFEREWYGRERSSVEALERCATEARELLDAIARTGAAA